jgi:uncharacterized protein YukJ
MALARYGVLKGKAIERLLGAGTSPHYQVHVVDDETDYRIAVNVKSKTAPSELLYLVEERFQHPIVERLADLPLGFTSIESKPDRGALDYIRGNLFDRTRMRPLPFDVPGFDNDLNEKVDAVVQRAMATEDALIYAFGQRWGPESAKDKYFGFKPGNGIHDIHMNQGNAAQFREDDGVWQDGGMLIHFPSQGQWVGVFLKFQSQTWHTDDATGHAIGEPVPVGPPPVPGPGGPVVPPTAEEPHGMVRIVAALVNSIASPEVETVTLLNTSPRPIALDGWALADKLKNRHPLAGPIGPGASRLVTVRPPMQLSNKGGIITLLDDQGLKVDGVAYTKAQAANPGWTIVF